MYNIEDQYLDLMKSVLVKENIKNNRTGVRTLQSHGAILRHNPDQGFPLLTTRLVPFKMVAAELLWFLSGSDDCQDLIDQGCNIWNGNAEDYVNNIISTTHRIAYDEAFNISGIDTKEKAEKYRDERVAEIKEKYPKTYVGRIYGKLWREFFMGDYAAEEGEFFDQIRNAIVMIKNDPDSRRILVTGWNPVEIFNPFGIPMGCLPPCHVLHRYSVDGDRLNMTLYQRSADLFLGVPFNIASYALLNAMMAQVTGLKPGNIVYFLDDVHIYETHIKQCKTQLARWENKTDFPKLILNEEINDIDGFDLRDMIVVNYFHEAAIKAEMVR